MSSLTPRTAILLRLLLAVGLLGVLASLPGCEAGRSGAASATNGAARPEVDPEELASALQEFDDFFDKRITAAANDVAASTRERAVGIAAVRWKATAVPRVRELAYDDDPLVGLVKVWAFCIRQREYLKIGGGSVLFGESQPLAIAAADVVLARIEEIAAAWIPAEDLGRVAEFARVDAAAHPITGVFDDSGADSAPVSETALARMGNLVSLPLSPLMTFSKVNRTADNFTEFNRIADRIADILEGLPREGRWQAELLLYDVEARETTTRLIESAEQISDSAETLSAAARDLPQTMSGLLDELQPHEERLAALVADAAKASEDLRLAVESARPLTEGTAELARELTTTAGAWESTARAVEGVLSDIENLTESSGSGGDSEPFRIADYRDTATELRRAAEELRGLLADVETLDSTPLVADIDARTREAVALTSQEARGLIDYAYGRAVRVVLLLGGVLLVALGLAAVLLKKRRPV